MAVKLRGGTEVAVAACGDGAVAALAGQVQALLKYKQTKRWVEGYQRSLEKKLAIAGRLIAGEIAAIEMQINEAGARAARSGESRPARSAYP